MTKPLGGFQPPSGTMLWGSRAGGRGGRLSDALFCVLCFVFRILCFVLGAMPCCPLSKPPAAWVGSPPHVECPRLRQGMAPGADRPGRLPLARSGSLAVWTSTRAHRCIAMCQATSAPWRRSPLQGSIKSAGFKIWRCFISIPTCPPVKPPPRLVRCQAGWPSASLLAGSGLLQCTCLPREPGCQVGGTVHGTVHGTNE